MKQITFTENIIEKIDEILLNKMGATKKEEVSNYIDKAVFLYELNGKKIELSLEEELLDDITIISCEDEVILKSIKDQLEV